MSPEIEELLGKAFKHEPPVELVAGLGAAYRDFRIEQLRDVIRIAYAVGAMSVQEPSDCSNRLMELRDRVEALEASTAKGFQHIGETNKMVPDGSLVERVACAITGDPINWKPEARAAILAVADWLGQQELYIAATRLRQEAQ